MTTEWEVVFHITGTKKTAEEWRKRALAVLDASIQMKPEEDDTGAYCSGHVRGERAASES